MITLEDSVGFCGLAEEEVLAIAEHEHLPEIAAAALTQYLLSQEHGAARIGGSPEHYAQSAIWSTNCQGDNHPISSLRLSSTLPTHPE
jgi:hypothetical protein